MKKFFVAAICTAVLALNSFARASDEKPKKFNHYVGLQANELLRQLVNFSNTNTAVTNPYLAVYSISSVKSGWGAHVGVGYTYRKILDKSTALNRESKVNDLFYRFGVEKKFMLSKRFEAGVALDYAGGYQLDQTFNISVTNLGSTIDSSATTVADKTITRGGGPQFSLGFYITDRILIGTEATAYYSAQKKKSNLLVIDTTTELFNNNQQTVTTSNDNSELETDGFSLTLPVALFLTIKF